MRGRSRSYVSFEVRMYHDHGLSISSCAPRSTWQSITVVVWWLQLRTRGQQCPDEMEWLRGGVLGYLNFCSTNVIRLYMYHSRCHTVIASHRTVLGGKR
jgi:hypothetical protein